MGVQVIRDPLDDRRADHGGVGDTGHGRGLRSRPDPEPDGDRKPGMLSHARHRPGEHVHPRPLGARDTGDRNAIDEPARILKNPGHPVLSGRRRDQEDHVQTHGPGRADEGVRLLGRQIDDDHAIDAGVPGLGHEGIEAKRIQRVGVPHQHHRGPRIAAAKFAHDAQGRRHGGAGGQRPA